MSSHFRTLQASNLRKAPNKRRQGACDPCKASKTRVKFIVGTLDHQLTTVQCDGAQPCGACRSGQRKSRTCQYSGRAQRWAATQREIEEGRTVHCLDEKPKSSPCSQSGLGMAGWQPYHSALEIDYMFRPISAGNVVDEFIHVKQPKGQAAQAIRKAIDLNGHEGQIHCSTTMTMTQPQETNNCFLIASDLYQHNCPSGDTDNDLSPIQAKTNELRENLDLLKNVAGEGRLNCAWTECGRLLREAQTSAAGQVRLHLASPEELKDHQRLWLDLFDFDTFLSFILGYSSSFSSWQETRVLSSFSDRTLADDPYHYQRLDILQSMNRILNIDMSEKNGMTEFLLFVKRFIKLDDSDKPTTVEKVATCTTDKEPLIAQDLKIQANMLLVVVFCRTASICNFYSQEGNANVNQDECLSPLIQTLDLNTPRQRSNLCRMVIKHAKLLLEAFKNVCKRDPVHTARNWMRGQSARIATLLVAIARLRERGSDSREIDDHLRELEGLFQTLRDKAPENKFLQQTSSQIHKLGLAAALSPGHKPSKLRKKNISISPKSCPRTPRQDSNLVDNLQSTTGRRKRGVEICRRSPQESPSHQKRPRLSSTFGPYSSGPTVALEQVTATHMSFQPSARPFLFTDNSASYQEQVNLEQLLLPTINVDNLSADTESGVRALSGLSHAHHPGPPFIFPWKYDILHPPLVWQNGFSSEQLSVDLTKIPSDSVYGLPFMPSSGEDDPLTLGEGVINAYSSPKLVKPNSSMTAMPMSNS